MNWNKLARDTVIRCGFCEQNDEISVSLTRTFFCIADELSTVQVRLGGDVILTDSYHSEYLLMT